MGDLGAGKFDRRIDILTYTSDVDEVGAPKSVYSKKYTTWANVRFKNANEKEVVTKETSITNVVFTIRHRKDLDAKMKINYDKKVYNILGITEIGARDRYLEIICEQVEMTSGEISSGDQIINDDTNEFFIDNDGQSIILG